MNHRLAEQRGAYCVVNDPPVLRHVRQGSVLEAFRIGAR